MFSLSQMPTACPVQTGLKGLLRDLKSMRVAVGGLAAAAALLSGAILECFLLFVAVYVVLCVHLAAVHARRAATREARLTKDRFLYAPLAILRDRARVGMLRGVWMFKPRQYRTAQTASAR